MVSFSIIIVTHEREELLSKCLDSLKPGHSDWQLILVANGKELSNEIVEKSSSLTSNFVILKNETQLSPGKARNQAVQVCNTEWVFLLDDDAYVTPGYWEIVFRTLSDPKIDILGGPDGPAEGMNNLGEALAISLSSPLCSGITFARHKPVGKKLIEANEEKLTSCNLWLKRSIFDSVKFPEDFRRAEETVFLQNVSQLGKKMFYHPGLRVRHHRRQKFKEILKPSLLAGFYRSKAMKSGSFNQNPIFWLPVVFVFLHGLFFIDPHIFWYLVRMYLGLILFMSIALASKEKKLSLVPIIIFLHYTIVLLFGLGFLFERIGIKNGSK